MPRPRPFDFSPEKIASVYKENSAQAGAGCVLWPGRRQPAAACKAGWCLRSFQPRGGIAGKADGAAFLTEGKEDNAASGAAACQKTVVTSVH